MIKGITGLLKPEKKKKPKYVSEVVNGNRIGVSILGNTTKGKK